MLCTHFGDVTARARVIQVWGSGEDVQAPGEAPPLGQPCTEPRGLCQLWREAGRPVLDELYLNLEEGTLLLDPRISTSGERMMPWPRGTWQPKGASRSQRAVVHDPRRPCHTARAKLDLLRCTSKSQTEAGE